MVSSSVVERVGRGLTPFQAGIGDDPKQALTPEVLRKTITQARQLWAIRRG
jgi:hypothetical protein